MVIFLIPYYKPGTIPVRMLCGWIWEQRQLDSCFLWMCGSCWNLAASWRGQPCFCRLRKFGRSISRPPSSVYTTIDHRLHLIPSKMLVAILQHFPLDICMSGWIHLLVCAPVCLQEKEGVEGWARKGRVGWGGENALMCMQKNETGCACPSQPTSLLLCCCWRPARQMASIWSGRCCNGGPGVVREVVIGSSWAGRTASLPATENFNLFKSLPSFPNYLTDVLADVADTYQCCLRAHGVYSSLFAYAYYHLSVLTQRATTAPTILWLLSTVQNHLRH